MSSQYCTFSSLVIFYKSILSACKNKQNHRHRNIFYVCVHAIFRQAVKCNRTPAKQKHKSRTKPKRGERISINCTRPKCGCRDATALHGQAVGLSYHGSRIPFIPALQMLVFTASEFGNSEERGERGIANLPKRDIQNKPDAGQSA